VGHSYIVYAPLLYGATTIIFEGKPVGTPDAGAYWRVIEEYDVKCLYTAPTAFRAIKKEDPSGELIKKYNLKNFKSLFLVGERADPDTVHWAENMLGRPVIDHWWQTETGWPMASNFLGLGKKFDTKYGFSTKPVPGYQIAIFDDEGKSVAPNELGNIAVKLPLPPGALVTLYKSEKRYLESYLKKYPGYYLAGDAGYFDDDGYLFIMSRIDDVINVGGVRLSTGAMEEVIAEHQTVAECCVIGPEDKMKGQIPVALVVLKSGVLLETSIIEKEIIHEIRNRIGAFTNFKKVAFVRALPKTRSGKILRGTLTQLCDGKDVKLPATIEDEDSLKVVAIEALNKLGFSVSEKQIKS